MPRLCHIRGRISRGRPRAPHSGSLYRVSGIHPDGNRSALGLAPRASKIHQKITSSSSHHAHYVRPDDLFSGPQARLHRIFLKITQYQRSLPDGRAIELEELQKHQILSPADFDFMASHSVTYKPHKLSD